MRVSPGTVEQAIFTWSRNNLGSAKGQGIGEVSPGLREHVGWLNSFDLNFLRPFVDEFAGGSDAYDGWESLVAVGALPVDEMAVVFRTIAKAGRDGVGRNRFLVHMLIGRKGEFDLSSVSIDDPHWLRAEQAPLNQLPRLPALSLADLTPRRVSHDCDVVDREARSLLEDLIGHRRALTRPQPPGSSPTTALLAAVPTALWGQIRLGWAVGKESPLVSIGLFDEQVKANAAGSASHPELHSCALHQEVEEIWNGMPAGSRTWTMFSQAYLMAMARIRHPAVLPDKPQQRAEGTDSARARAAAEIATAIDAMEWDESRALSDGEALQALGRLERLAAPAEGWLRVLAAPELCALFSGIHTKGGFTRSLRFFERTNTPIDSIVERWRDTSLAVFGFGALILMPESVRRGSWAVPKRIDREELNKLMRQLRVTDGGMDLIARLLNAGFAADAEARRAVVASLAEAKASPREIFAVLIPRAELAARTEAQFMRENADLVIQWLKVPDQSAEAFRLGLEPRRRFFLPRLLHPSRMFEI